MANHRYASETLEFAARSGIILLERSDLEWELGKSHLRSLELFNDPPIRTRNGGRDPLTTPGPMFDAGDRGKDNQERPDLLGVLESYRKKNAPDPRDGIRGAESPLTSEPRTPAALPGGGGPRTTVEIIRMRETREHLRRFADEWKDSGIDDVHVTDYLTWHGSVEDRRVEGESDGPAYKPCAAPFRHGCILTDGTVVPCCLDVNGQMPLGQIPEQSFKDIWISHRYRQLRLQLLTGTVSPGCICDGCANTFRDV